jgi:hypothetical protein
VQGSYSCTRVYKTQLVLSCFKKHPRRFLGGGMSEPLPPPPCPIPTSLSSLATAGGGRRAKPISVEGIGRGSFSFVACCFVPGRRGLLADRRQKSGQRPRAEVPVTDLLACTMGRSGVANHGKVRRMRDLGSGAHISLATTESCCARRDDDRTTWWWAFL